MMIVKNIEELDTRRCKIFLDDQSSFVLYKKEVAEYGIGKNRVLEMEEYCKIIKEILPKRAKKRALYLLQKRPYTEQKLREKLQEGGYPSLVIDEAIDYVKDYHYIDDLAYAREYVFFHKEKLPKKMIQDKLRNKGVGKDELYRVFQEAYQDRMEEEELQLKQARALLEKRSYNRENPEPKEVQKNYAYLMGKGFSTSVIRKVLREKSDY